MLGRRSVFVKTTTCAGARATWTRKNRKTELGSSHRSLPAPCRYPERQPSKSGSTRPHQAAQKQDRLRLANVPRKADQFGKLIRKRPEEDHDPNLEPIDLSHRQSSRSLSCPSGYADPTT